MSVSKKVISLDLKRKNRLQTVAKECLKKADKDWEVAARLMKNRISNDSALYKALLEPLIDEAIWYHIRMASHRDRQTFTGRPVGADNASGVVAMATAEVKKWLDYPLSGGRKLGDADRELLLEEAAMHEAFAKGNIRQAKLYTIISSRIGSKIVKKVLTDEQIQKVWEKVS